MTPTVEYTCYMAKRKPTKLSDQLRQLVRDSEHTAYRICQETGIDKGALSHFLAGHRGLSMDTVDILGRFLGLELRPARKGR